MEEKPRIAVPPVLYKYRRWSDEKGNVDLHSKKMLEDDEFFFASPKSFNDPFDCAIDPTFEGSQKDNFDKVAEALAEHQGQDAQETRREIQRRFRLGKLSWPKIKHQQLDLLRTQKDNASGILSFSANPTSGLMWSHYADSHRGFCVGVSTEKLSSAIEAEHKTSEVNIGIDPVLYCDQYPDLPFYAELGGNHQDQLRANLAKIFLQKSTDWKYEKEHRLIMFRKDGKNLSDEIRKRSYPGVITEVILGLRCSENVENSIRATVREGIAIRRAIQAERKFAIKIVSA